MDLPAILIWLSLGFVSILGVALAMIIWMKNPFTLEETSEPGF